MSDDPVIEAVRALAGKLSGAALIAWSAKLPNTAPTAGASAALVAPWATGAHAHVNRFLKRWRERFPEVSGEALGLSLRTWIAANEGVPEIELTWSGPMPTTSHLRRTEQVLLQMVEQAQESLWIITYSAYDVAEVKSALQAAVKRGVDVRFVLETEESGELKGDPAKALGVGEGAKVYVWPEDKRPKTESQRGVLHAKAAIRDDIELLLTSANLTGSAMHFNMELGIVIRGDEARRAIEHLRALQLSGELERQAGGATGGE